MKNLVQEIGKKPVTIKWISLILFTTLLINVSCNKNSPGKNNSVYDPSISYSLQNISYGSNSQQIMDIYLPANRKSSSTKVFVLIHGGGWSAGDKTDLTDVFNNLKSNYPNDAIININYQLGTTASPGYPKQINDIKAALSGIQQQKYNLSSQYFLFGVSAGAHLAMLYGYAFDAGHQVKAICNTVGPADLTDTSYTNNNLAYMPVLEGLVGNVLYAQNPGLYAEVSPVKHITSSSPPTISFYGDTDPLIPSTQMGLLKKALDDNGVYNEATMYAGAGHGNWNTAQSQDYALKIVNFINSHF
ncbi:MAG: alpha/beta hydrolase [Ginsengibacter sp.]